MFLSAVCQGSDCRAGLVHIASMIHQILLQLLILLSTSGHANSYASWLKCYVDLTDTESEVIMNNRIIPSDQARYHGVKIEVKLAEDDHWLDSLEYHGDRTSTVTARLKVPPELSESSVVQYAMETSSGASFVRPKMCDGRRSHGMHYTDSVVLEISGSTETVELVAGYATGHEAVTLTETLVLSRRNDAREL
jgi:hypothetical protein